MKFHLTKEFISRFVTVRFQAVSMLILLGIITFFFYNALQHFNASDPAPLIKPFYPLPVSLESSSIVEVDVGIHIINFPNFDFQTNNFIIEAIIWFAFNPSLLTLATVSQFSFQKGSFLSKVQTNMRLVGDKLFVQYAIRLQFTSNLYHRLFPINDHYLYLMLVNQLSTVNEMVFKVSSSSITIPRDTQIEEWILVDKQAKSGYIEATLDHKDQQKGALYPAVLFTLDFAKGGVRKIFVIMLPLLLIYFISIFTFAITPNPAGLSLSIKLAVGAITGLITYRFVIDKIIPNVAYFTLADHIYNLFLTTTFIILLIDILTSDYAETTDRTTITFIRGLAFIIIQLILIFSMYYLLNNWTHTQNHYEML